MFKPVLPSVCRLFAMLGLASMGACACAASLSVQVADEAGRPLADAVVYAEPATAAPAQARRTIEIEQKGRQFVPQVTVVQTGTAISFPNHDTVRHHVYSFSPAKQFELKLYSGVPPTPLVFDNPGTVVLGCNIHDQMVAYIQVVPTPFFGKTDAAGKVSLAGLPAGKYTLKAWHPHQSGSAVAEQATQVAGEDRASFRLKMKPAAAIVAARSAAY